MRADRTLPSGDVLVYRHPWPVRITHWLNVLCLTVLLGSGLQIFNAHPALYWGEVSDFGDPWLEIGAAPDASGQMAGFLAVGGLKLDTTGFLGRTGEGATARSRAFPAWATLPGYQDLGAGRRWHFFFAWLFGASLAVYLVYALVSRRLTRTLTPTGAELRGIGRAIRDHVTFHFDHGARGYNVLQKLSYLVVVLGLLPVMILTGLGMAPAVNAAVPWLTDLFGGRQSARTLHFLCAAGLVLFVLVHVLMVLAAGPVNELRAMLTGWFRVRRPKAVAP